jgi:putative restriction endonuclease
MGYALSAPMRFWWVNHKQTFRHEVGGKYLWCPKRRRDGARHHFYETAREVQPGDLVFSYAHAAVQAVGVARTYCYSCPQPDEFGKVGEAWNGVGWRVDVEFQMFAQPLRTASVMDRLQALLPEKYSPIKRDGFGNQGAYLAEITRAMATQLLELGAPLLLGLMSEVRFREDSGIVERSLDSLVEWEEFQERRLVEDVSSETERRALIKARVGQGVFRQRVGQLERACRVTLVDNPEHLIASHIKPWREADNEERLHEANGLLLTPSIDHLFDRGFISFSDEGELLLSPVADPVSLHRMGIRNDQPVRVGRFHSDQKHFLNYHRNEVFLKSAS